METFQRSFPQDPGKFCTLFNIPLLIIEIIHIEGGRRKWCYAKVIFVRKVKLQCGFAVRYGYEAEALSENEAINAHRAYTGGETQKAIQKDVDN